MPVAPPPTSDPVPAGGVRVHDTVVRPRSPGWAAAWCLLTLGVTGAVRHGRLNGELARVGRARGTMPFPFVPVDVSVAVLAWVTGLLTWALVTSNVVDYVVRLFDGRDPVAADITGFSGQLLLLAPMWITLLHTARRIRTVQHLVGVDPVRLEPWHVALAGVLFPPVATWMAQREANRAWRVWEAAA